MKLSLVLLLLSALLSGCSVIEEYPKNWPPVQVLPGATCPDIAGIYYDTPDNTNDQTSSPPFAHKSLSEKLFCTTSITSCNIQGGTGVSVEIQQPDLETLRFLARKQNVVIYERELKRGSKEYWQHGRATSIIKNAQTFDCKTGSVNFTKVEFMPPIGEGYWDKTTYKLYRVENGDLAMQVNRNGNMIIIFVLPLMFIEKHWYRWPMQETEGIETVH